MPSRVENVILGGAEVVIPPAWNVTKKVAGGLYGAARWAWSCIPEGSAKKATEEAWENTQYKTALKTAGAIGAGTLAAGATILAAPLVVTAGAITTGVAALTAGGATAAATLMAEYPDHSVLVNIPQRKPLELRTPGVDAGPPIDPTTSFAAVSANSAAFNQNQPTGMSARRLVEKTANDPQKAKALKDQQTRTDRQKDRLIENASAYTSAYFIFANRLGLNTQLANGDDILMEMTQAATARVHGGEKANFWDACMSTLEKRGIELSLPQWIRAKFWYFLTEFIGIVPNTFKEVGDRILNHFRGGVEGDQSKGAILRILQVTSSFLDKYNSAARSYANAGQAGLPPAEGDLAFYQKKIIDELGDSSAVAKAISKMKPGEDLGEVVMQELCKEFVVALVDDPEIFPSIPFFTGLQKMSIFGIRIGIIFDLMEWIFGGIINWVGKKLIKGYAPDALQAIVQKGIDQAMPGRYSFKIAVANSLKAQVEDLKTELANGIPSTPLRFEENRLLNETIAKLIKTLELNACGGDQDAIRKKFEELANPSNDAKELKEHLHIATLKGARLLIHHYTQKPEAIEELFEKLFELSSEPFQVGAPVQTEVDYDNALRSLKDSVHALVKEQVKEGVLEKVLGENPEVLLTFLDGKRVAVVDKQGNPIPGVARDAKGKPVHQLDAQGKPVYKGLFHEQKDKAIATAQVLKGLSLRMLKEMQTDSAANIPAPAENPQDAANPQIIAAQENIAAAQTEVNDAEDQVEAEEMRNPEDQDPFKLMEANNTLTLAKIELRIAKEELRIKKEILRLEASVAAAQAAVNGAQGPALVTAQNKLRIEETSLALAREELGLVRSMEELNGLATTNDHLLKNLDNYMKVIDDFAEYVKSLNINLYDPMVQKLMYRTFGQIYQGVVPLTEQSVALQSIEKSYDKSKKLAKQFADVGEKIRQNPHNLIDHLREMLIRIRAIDESFNEFQADPGNNVTPFAVLIQQLVEHTQECQVQDYLLSIIKELGASERLSYEILAHPKKWVEEIRRRVPVQDQALLFRAIATLQKNAALSPIPDLTADHAEVAAQYAAVVQKHTDLKQARDNQRAQKVQEIANWASVRKATAEIKRNQTRGQLVQGFQKLKKDTDALAKKIEDAELPPMHFPVHVGVPYIPGAAGAIDKHITNPIVDKVTNLTESAYDFLTSLEITEAGSRLALGEFIRNHRRPPERGFLDRMMT